jgi:tryptophan synthase alpha chain
LSDPLAARWAAARSRRTAALIPYITAGFPNAAATRALLAGAADAGADILELGIPWSDPVADGPVIQASTFASLQGGTTLGGVLDLLADARPSVPVVLFSYINPILAFGAKRFAARAREAGASAVLVTDLPVGADPAVEAELRSSGLPFVRLVAPTTADARLAAIAAASEGFVYLIARLGVTGRGNGERGAAERVQTQLAERVAAVRAVTPLPVAVGFGISEPSQARDVAGIADGVVIGSALVERMKSGGAEPALRWLREVRAAMDTVPSPA